MSMNASSKRAANVLYHIILHPISQLIACAYDDAVCATSFGDAPMQCRGWIAGAPRFNRIRRLRRMLIGGVRDGVTGSGDILSSPRGGVTGAQHRRGRREQEHGQTNHEDPVHAAFLYECQIPTLCGAGGRPGLGSHSRNGVAQSRLAALAVLAMSL